jgi:hypothetical protein
MILAQDAQRPKLIAETGNAFTSKSSPLYEVPSTDVMLVGWVAYSFLAVPIVISLTKLNVKAAA